MANEGDWRVLVVMNAVLSVAFVALVVRVLSFIDVLAFSWETVGGAAAVLFVCTYLLVFR